MLDSGVDGQQLQAPLGDDAARQRYMHVHHYRTRRENVNGARPAAAKHPSTAAIILPLLFPLPYCFRGFNSLRVLLLLLIKDTAS